MLVNDEHEHNQTVKALKETIKDKEECYLRVMADFDNYRKRIERDIESEKREGEKKLIFELLEIVDNLERALSSGECNINSFKEGIHVIYVQLLEIFKKHGAYSFEAIGKKFDPRFHQAIGSMESHDFSNGIIGEEFRKGYYFYEDLLRPSLVRVVKN